MKVLVRFKDNDFIATMNLFGELLSKVIHHRTLTEKVVADWFNQVSFVLYDMTRRDGEVRTETQKQLEHTKAYLQISPEDVFIGKDVDKKLETYSQWGNHDSILVETTKPRGVVVTLL